jgi:hypothetical protein
MFVFYLSHYNNPNSAKMGYMSQLKDTSQMENYSDNTVMS